MMARGVGKTRGTFMITGPNERMQLAGPAFLLFVV